MCDFYLLYELGMHHVWIRVPKNSFWKVIDDLGKEFEIFKDTNPDDEERTDYYIINYWGDRQDIAYTRDILPADNDRE